MTPDRAKKLVDTLDAWISEKLSARDAEGSCGGNYERQYRDWLVAILCEHDHPPPGYVVERVPESGMMWHWGNAEAGTGLKFFSEIDALNAAWNDYEASR